MDVVKSYHDKEIIGYYYSKAKKELVFELESDDNLKFNSVIQFELNFVSDQNVISDIYNWLSSEIPDNIREDYPFLNNFQSSKVKCYFIDSSVGLTGIVICQD